MGMNVQEQAAVPQETCGFCECACLFVWPSLESVDAWIVNLASLGKVTQLYPPNEGSLAGALKASNPNQKYNSTRSRVYNFKLGLTASQVVRLIVLA